MELLTEGRAILNDDALRMTLDDVIADTPPELDEEDMMCELPNGRVGTYQELVKQTFLKDIRDQQADQVRAHGGSFSDATLRVMFAVWSRCPSAHKAFRHHRLHRVPSERTMRDRAQAGVGLRPGMPQSKIVRKLKQLRERTQQELQARLGPGQASVIPNEWQVGPGVRWL